MNAPDRAGASTRAAVPDDPTPAAQDQVVTVKRSFAAWATIWASRIFVRPTLWLLPLHSLVGVLGYRFTQVVACGMWFGPTLPHTAVDATGPRGRIVGEWVGGSAERGAH